MSLSPAEFRKAMGCFATGVTIVTLDLDGEVHGMTANAFASVSLDPPLLLICVDHSARTHAHLHAKERFGINILAEHQRVIIYGMKFSAARCLFLPGVPISATE